MKSGRGILHIAGIPGAFEGEVEIDGGLVTIDGELVTQSGPSWEPVLIRRPRTVRSWPVRSISSIEWTDQVAA